MTVQEAFIGKIQIRLNELNDEVERLQNIANTTEGEKKSELFARLSELNEKRGRLESKLADLQEAGKDAETEMQAGVENAWRDFNDTVEAARLHFR